MIGYWLGQQQARECREMCARAAEWLSGRQDGALEESRLESAVAEASKEQKREEVSPEVPAEVKDSIAAADKEPEAAANTEAVEEKKAVEARIRGLFPRELRMPTDTPPKNGWTYDFTPVAQPPS